MATKFHEALIIIEWIAGQTKKNERQEDKPLPDKTTIITPEDIGFVAKVDGQPTYNYAKKYKDNIEMMLACVESELSTKEKNSNLFLPAPFYFKRIAILSRKSKNYEQEIKYCKIYLKALDEYRGPLVINHLRSEFQNRIKRAKQLMSKNKK